jgi:lipopolysaccharide/colanic/teichoic acid biosynthesis glycosyltransferase/GGDEF domain-containing protein
VRRKWRVSLDKREGWYSKDVFFKILKKERNRSTRTGLPLSYVVIDLKKSIYTLNQLSRKEFDHFFEKLIDLVSENTRDFDIKHLRNPDKIIILLIDTCAEGAKSFINKILSIFDQYFDSADKMVYLKIIKSITTSTYPLSEEFDYDTIEADLKMVLNSTPRKKPSEELPPKMYRDSLDLNFERHMIPLSNGSLTLSSPIFLDISDPTSRQAIYRVAKRAIDIIGAVSGLLFLSPLFLLCALAVKLTSKGPVLFKQTRVGQFGKRFTFIKFRTMFHNCDSKIHQDYVEKLIEGDEGQSLNMGSEEKPLYKLNDDPRVTKIGEFLRKTSLDELPQFFNILMGDMSLVGPRPAISYEVKKYKHWHLRRVLETKPGLTGLWQVNGRSNTDFNTMVRLDLQYIKNQSIPFDILILLKTFKSVLKRDGAS